MPIAIGEPPQRTFVSPERRAAPLQKHGKPSQTRLQQPPAMTSSIAPSSRAPKALVKAPSRPPSTPTFQAPLVNPRSRNSSGTAYSSRPLPAQRTTSSKKYLLNEQEENTQCDVGTSDAIEGFIGQLHEHQKYARTWMAECEADPKRRGGILNDMGLGKTIEIIVRINDCKRLQKKEGPTLVVCPANLKPQWAAELARFSPQLTVYNYHGARRTKDPSDLLSYDVVLTTYNILMTEKKTYSREREAKKGPASWNGLRMAVFRTHFLRVVLDECHMIRNADTQTAEACCLLNKLNDLHSYFKFLSIPPYNGQSGFQSSTRGGSVSSIATYMAKFHLRRTKEDQVNGRPIVDLPSKTLEVCPVELDHQEQEIYDALKGVSEESTDGFLVPSNEYTDAASRFKDTTNCLFTLFLRLRQACCHPRLCFAPVGDEDLEDGQITSVDSDQCYLCLCLKPSKEIKEGFCYDCRHQVVKPAKAGSDDKLYSRNAKIVPSSKMRFMWQLILNIQEHSKGKDKIIVFSQWTSFLDMISNYLSRKTTATIVEYNGRTSLSQRQAVLESFNNDPKVTIGLFSINAGGIGLNLAAANHVILMDLQWNPAVEDQAFDRVHRIGQTKPVKIYKLLVRDTIEVGIQQIQMRKRRMAEEVLAGVQTAAKHNTLLKELAKAAKFNRIN